MSEPTKGTLDEGRVSEILRWLGTDLLPWQLAMAERMLDAYERGNRLVLVPYGRRGGSAWMEVPRDA